MGERLVFDVHRGTSVDDYIHICSIHFHWSAYTKSIYHEAKFLIEGMKRHGYNMGMTDEETVQMFINILQENVVNISEVVIPHQDGTKEKIPAHKVRGGVEKGDIEFAREHGYVFEEADVSASEGVIGISEEVIENMHDNAEDIEDFYMDEGWYTNGLYTTLTISDIENMQMEVNVNEVPDYNPPISDPSEPKFEDTDKLIEWLTGINDWIVGKYEEYGILFFVTIYRE